MQCAATPPIASPSAVALSDIPLCPLLLPQLSVSVSLCRLLSPLAVCLLPADVARCNVVRLPLATCQLHVCLGLPCLSAHLPQVDVTFALLTFCIMSNFMSNVAYA